MQGYLEEVEQAEKSKIFLSKDLAILKIQANQNDPLIFQSLFCPTCQDFVLANGFFLGPDQHTPGHPLAWLPSQDEPAQGRTVALIENWLRTAPISESRRQELSLLAPQINSLSWGLALVGQETFDWLAYLENYLNELADSWLAALNGLDTAHFRAEEIWFRPATAYNFAWSPEIPDEAA